MNLSRAPRLTLCLVAIFLSNLSGVQLALSQEGDDLEALNKQYLEFYKQGKYAQAVPIAKALLEIYEKNLGPEHQYTLSSLNNLAVIYRHMGDCAKAEPLFQRALKIQEKVLGPEHQYTAASLNNLAGLYRRMGDYAKAEPLYQRALRIQEKVLAPEHSDTAASLNNLAGLYQDMGDYPKAKPLYQRALKMREKVLGPEHPVTATTLNNLAGLYHVMADYAKAEPLYQRALKIQEKVLGSEHPNTALSLNNLALLYEVIGDYAKAEPLYQRALKIWEKVLGSEHPNTALSLANLAGLYLLMSDYAKAELLCQRALKIREKVLGPEHPDTATSLDSLNLLYLVMGDYAKAEPLCQRALKIREKVLGPEHPDTACSLNNLAWLFLDMGKTAQAVEIGSSAVQAKATALANILSFTSEQQRLAYQATVDPNTYTLLARFGSAPHLALAILRYKGVVLDSLLEDRLVAQASQDAAQHAAIEQLQAAKLQLSRLLFEVPKDFSEAARQRSETEQERLSEEVEQLEGSLARQVTGLGRARRALGVTVEQVQAVLPKEAALVELLRYSHYLGKFKGETRYGAIILAASGEPKWVSLGEAAAIETDLARYRKAVRGSSREELPALLKTLHRTIWLPVEAALPAGIKTVIMSPDGQLNFLSFATLITSDDQFLGQKYSLRYVSSGRDLFRETKPSASQQLEIYACSDFSDKRLSVPPGLSNSLVALRSVERGDFQAIYLATLPNTLRESAALEGLAKTWSLQVKVYLDAQATESQLHAVRSPRILHLATHGFFLSETEVEKSGPGGSFRGVGRVGGLNSFTEPSLLSDSGSPLQKPVFLKNPMHRSGLALAGAQATLDAWKRGEVPLMDNDGIVTAEEVGGLKLDGTWLVVLSACDTGVGVARSGEGVLGLRRGFIQAGAQNLLMTLWPVADEETVRIMVDFYEAAHRTGNAPQALAEVQRDWLVKLRKEQDLAKAVRIAGPFIMSSQGTVK